MGPTLTRLFGEGFRVFFLAAGLFGVVALIWWELYLWVHASGGLITDFSFAMAPHEWHAHELVFGYGGAALGGFLLSMLGPGRRGFVALAAGLWLAGRLALWLSGALPWGLVAVLDLAFAPLIWGRLALPFLRRPKPQNAVFLVFLALFWSANLATHLGWARIWPEGGVIGPRAGLLTLGALILAVGGRLAPGFTRNAMHRAGLADSALPHEPRWGAPVGLGLGATLALSALILPDSPLLAALAALLGAAQLARQSRWGLRFALGQPLLAAMHLAAGSVALGLLGLAAARAGLLSEVAALHLIGIGGVGGMTLAVMTRQALGLTGRPTRAPGAAALAFGLIALAALARFAASSLGGPVYFPATLTAGAAWVLGYTLWLAALWPVLWGPRRPR